MHSADAPGGSVLPGAQDLSRRAARCAPACRPGSPPADRETPGGGSADGRVRLRQRGRRSNVGCTLDRRHGLRALPGRVRLCGAPAGEGGSRRCVHHTLPDVSGRFTRACRSDHFKATLNKNEPFNSWPPSTRPSLRSLPLLSFSLSLSLSLSLLNLFLCLSHLSPPLLSLCVAFSLSLSPLSTASLSRSLARARALSLSSLFFRSYCPVSSPSSLSPPPSLSSSHPLLPWLFLSRSLFFRESIPRLSLFLGVSLSLPHARPRALFQEDERRQKRRWRGDGVKREKRE